MQALDLVSVIPVIKRHLRCDIALINTMTESILKNKGKGVRSELILELSKAGKYNLDDPALREDLLTVCAIVEMIHTGTLVHDDVIDTSKTRRGQLAHHEIFGNTCSVLMGDYLFTKAFSLSLKLDKSTDFLQILSHATEKLVEGELLQIQFNKEKIFNLETYEKIVECKTAHLFSLATETVGLLLDPGKRSIFKIVGHQVGVLFQIIDDYLDYFSDQNTLGKPIGGDFKERKITHPILIAQQHGFIDQTSFYERELSFEKIMINLHKARPLIVDHITNRKRSIKNISQSLLHPQQAKIIINTLDKICLKHHTLCDA